MKVTFGSWAKLTLLFIYLVIIAGGVVRMTGSGMGCPDWPKCFGQWIPPTDVSQLPENYQEIYSHKGFTDTTFNAAHTWTEYVNRLIGALAGLMVFVMMVWSFKYRRTKPRVFWLSVLTFVLMGFQAWLGKVVVYSVLQPFKITIHMLVALIIVSVMLWLLSAWNERESLKVSSKVKSALLFILILTVIQVVLGTQVRQSVDQISRQFNHVSRGLWIDHVDWWFYIHRSFSILLLLSTFVLVWRARLEPKFKVNAFIISVLVFTIAVIGVIMVYAGFPKITQPLHLVMSSIFWGYLFYQYKRTSSILM